MIDHHLRKVHRPRVFPVCPAKGIHRINAVLIARNNPKTALRSLEISRKSFESDEFLYRAGRFCELEPIVLLRW